MSRTVKKGDGIEGMPRVSEIVWRVNYGASEPYEIKVIKRNPKSIDILYIMRDNDGGVSLWEVWRQYPDGFTIEVKTKREAWDIIIRRKESEVSRARVSVVHAVAALESAIAARDKDPEDY